MPFALSTQGTDDEDGASRHIRLDEEGAMIEQRLRCYATAQET